MTKSGKHCGKRRNCTFFKKPSASEASESVYMRERVKKNMVLSAARFSINLPRCFQSRLLQICCKQISEVCNLIIEFAIKYPYIRGQFSPCL